MRTGALQLETLNTEIINYIKELQAKHNELEAQYNQRLKETEFKYQEIKSEYLILKERYDLLLYKRFARSAERLTADDKQLSLFTEEEEAEQTTTAEPETGKREIKSYTRRKPGANLLTPPSRDGKKL